MYDGSFEVFGQYGWPVRTNKSNHGNFIAVLSYRTWDRVISGDSILCQYGLYMNPDAEEDVVKIPTRWIRSDDLAVRCILASNNFPWKDLYKYWPNKPNPNLTGSSGIYLLLLESRSSSGCHAGHVHGGSVPAALRVSYTGVISILIRPAAAEDS